MQLQRYQIVVQPSLFLAYTIFGRSCSSSSSYIHHRQIVIADISLAINEEGEEEEEKMHQGRNYK